MARGGDGRHAPPLPRHRRRPRRRGCPPLPDHQLPPPRPPRRRRRSSRPRLRPCPLDECEVWWAGGAGRAATTDEGTTSTSSGTAWRLRSGRKGNRRGPEAATDGGMHAATTGGGGRSAWRTCGRVPVAPPPPTGLPAIAAPARPWREPGSARWGGPPRAAGDRTSSDTPGGREGGPQIPRGRDGRRGPQSTEIAPRAWQCQWELLPPQRPQARRSHGRRGRRSCLGSFPSACPWPPWPMMHEAFLVPRSAQPSVTNRPRPCRHGPASRPSAAASLPTDAPPTGTPHRHVGVLRCLTHTLASRQAARPQPRPGWGEAAGHAPRRGVDRGRPCV